MRRKEGGGERLGEGERLQGTTKDRKNTIAVEINPHNHLSKQPVTMAVWSDHLIAIEWSDVGSTLFYCQTNQQRERKETNHMRILKYWSMCISSFM